MFTKFAKRHGTICSGDAASYIEKGYKRGFEAGLDAATAERDELRQKVAEYADALLKEYKGFGGRGSK